MKDRISTLAAVVLAGVLAVGCGSTSMKALQLKNFMLNDKLVRSETDKKVLSNEIKAFRDEIEAKRKLVLSLTAERNELKKAQETKTQETDAHQQAQQALKARFVAALKDQECEVLSRGAAIVIRAHVGIFSGGIEVDKGGQKLLRAVADAIREHGGEMDVRVEGHTDDKPIQNEKFPSNWELSGARAISAMRFLTDRCGLAAERASFAGYGPYAPVVPNIDAKSREKNRRIEIVLLPGK